MASSVRNRGSSSSNDDASTSATRVAKVREVFTILAQGVELYHFYRISKGKSKRAKKVLWLDSETLRLCIDDKRQTLTEKQQDFIPSGVYLKDIAVVREGSLSYEFVCSTERDPNKEERYLAVVASESTICLEFPSTDTRDWFLERLRLLFEDMLSLAEQAKRNARLQQLHPPAVAFYTDYGPAEVRANSHLKELLRRGIQVNHHHGGKVVSSLITYDAATLSFCVVPVSEAEDEDDVIESTSSVGEYVWRRMAQAASSAVRWVSALRVGREGGAAGAAGDDDAGDRLMGSTAVALDDVADIRVGTHSFGFVLSNCTDRHQQCMSIVGSQCTLDIELTSQDVRDTFAERLRKFVPFCLLEYKHFN